MTQEPFQLTNAPPKPQPWRGENRKATQRTLLAGLDCLPGQADLFGTDGELSKPRRKPRKLMHVCDAGPGDEEEDLVRFRCARCDHETEWMLMKTAEAKRGIPCPACNAKGAQ